MLTAIKLWASKSRVLLVLCCTALFLVLALYLMWRTADIIARGGRAEGAIETNQKGTRDADKASEGINAADACERQPGRMWDLRTGKCGQRPAASVPQPE